MTATAIFLALWATLIVAGNTAIGVALHGVMVRMPAKVANGISRIHAAIAVVVLLLVLLNAAAGANDPVRIIGFIAPDLAVLLTNIELGTALDATAGLAASLIALSRLRLGRFLPGARGGVRPTAARRHGGRPRRRRVHMSCANDDDDGEDDVLAA